MTISRRAFLISGVAAVSGLAAGRASADAGAEDYVVKLGADVLALAKGGRRGDRALQRRFANLLNRYINIPSIANFALGLQRANLPAGDKAMFYDLVSNYAAALFVWYVDDFQGSGLLVTNSAEQGKFVTVDSKIAGSNEPLRWRVLGSSGNYKVADINVKGVWLTIAMKKMFEDTLRASNGDFHPLYAKLREAETW